QGRAHQLPAPRPARAASRARLRPGKRHRGQLVLAVVADTGLADGRAAARAARAGHLPGWRGFFFGESLHSCEESAMGTTEKARLARFFIELGVKRWISPNIHVRPLVAELFLTENCNLRCISCACWLENTKGELATQEWKEVIDQLVRLRIIKANFTGG